MLGLVAGKVLQEPFRHPTKNFVMLPRGTLLGTEVIEAIRLMGCERQAIMCLGEIIGPDTPLAPDALVDGPVAAAKIDREIRLLRHSRDVASLFLALLFIFALALRQPVLVVLAILTAACWGALHLQAVRGGLKLEAISLEMNEARMRRIEGEKQLQEAALRLGLLKHPKID